MKKCPKCGIEKDENEFYKHKYDKGKGSYISWCKICNSDDGRERRVRYPGNNYNRRSRYHISIEEYNNLLKLQNNVCAICGKSEISLRNGKIRTLCVDHDHKTNRIRGLLCDHCNRLLGYAYDDLHILLNAIKYLERNSNIIT